ncbi:MAG TPA: 1,6-anhydro-N-acetylmuramyl-L-alanine amidase AmpD [Mariprofundaceae bacterium]|nr:1,6-anhydro-N-acetylmuramyl-L-alanine amidase AmpD [Mariprofundaceae bacterium]
MTHLRFLPSGHCDERPAGTDIDLIVLHAISLPPGEFSPTHVEALFTGCLDHAAHPFFADLEGLRVSAHFVIDRQGGITQFVPVLQRAWHAGDSSWEERPRCNDYSIGIEIIGDEQQPFTPAQYREAARLCRDLIQRFPAIGRNRIVGHRDVAPGRKWDPGRQWDWTRFHRSLAHIRRAGPGFY